VSSRQRRGVSLLSGGSGQDSQPPRYAAFKSIVVTQIPA
jgi:hypothetical protein